MTQPEIDRLDRIEGLLERLTGNVDHLSKNVDHLSKDVEHLSQDVEGLKQEVSKTNDRVEIYQKASQQVVNLAFSLILAATAAIVIPVVLGR